MKVLVLALGLNLVLLFGQTTAAPAKKPVVTTSTSKKKKPVVCIEAKEAHLVQYESLAEAEYRGQKDPELEKYPVPCPTKPNNNINKKK